MKTGMHQHASLQQTLKMNPRLYQAMDLLYMPLLDLQQHLKQELLSNPFLEMAEAEEESPLDATQVETKPEKNEESGDDEPDWENILLDDGAQGLAAPRDLSPAREYVEPVAPTTRDLADHLRDQVQMLDLTPRQQLMADEYLGNIAEDGYLGASLEEIVAGANQLLAEHAGAPDFGGDEPCTPPAAWGAMPHTARRLAPPGVGARDLRERLLLQLEDQGQQASLVYKLVPDASDALSAHRWSELGKRFGLEPAEAQ